MAAAAAELSSEAPSRHARRGCVRGHERGHNLLYALLISKPLTAPPHARYPNIQSNQMNNVVSSNRDDTYLKSILQFQIEMKIFF